MDGGELAPQCPVDDAGYHGIETHEESLRPAQMALDGTLTKEEIAEFFLTVPEFVNLFGPVQDLSDAELVEQLFLNTLDRPGEQAGVDFWVSVLADPEFSRAEMLLAFAQSPENQLGSPDIVTLEETAPGEWEFVV